MEDLQNSQEKFARICTATGEGMNEGWVFGDGDAYFKYEADALAHAKDCCYETLQEAYDDEAGYWTEWEEREEEEEQEKTTV
jgi:hypothetical protein